MSDGTATYRTIAVERAGPRTTITLDRPERRNLLDRPAAEELVAAFRAVQADPDARVLVLTGAGPAFSAGGDIRAFSEASPMELPDAIAPILELFRGAFALKVPIVARVGGHAFGGGAGLVSICDFAIAADDVELGYPEIHVGLIPAAVAVLLARMVPRRTAVDLLFTGRRVPAPEAARLGLLNEAVPRDALDARVDALAAELASRSPLALRQLKAAFYGQADLPLERALELAVDKFVELTTTEDCREGLAAFLAKREPVWKGR